MYEDSWYSYEPSFQQQRQGPSGTRHRRSASLLQQPNGAADHADTPTLLPALLEAREADNSPPEATLSRRAKSYSDFYEIATAQFANNNGSKKKKDGVRRRGKDKTSWEALMIPDSLAALSLDTTEEIVHDDLLRDQLLEASQQEYLLYHDQLALTERHLGTLVDDANSALKVLESLCQSFRAVEEQTSSFKAQCDDLITEQERLQRLADEVGTDLHYYAYLDNVTRRLNAPGAGRLVDGDAFGEVLTNLDSCIEFMTKNPHYRDAESYLARYQSLLTKALHLLEVGFTARLEKVSSEISKQIAATQSESTRHALAYGRFEEILIASFSLIPNIHRVVQRAYDPHTGLPKQQLNFDIYANTVNNLFHAYWVIRERDLKPIVQTELEAFKTEAKDGLETAARNFVKQSFERSFNEQNLFRKIFGLEVHFSADPKSAFVALKNSHQRNAQLVSASNVAPVAIHLQAALQGVELQTVANLVGWITSEYLILEYADGGSDGGDVDDEKMSPFAVHCREITSRLLVEHLWAFVDAFFEAEIAKSITKAVVAPDALKIGPVVNGNGASNAFPQVKKAIELLVLFDQSMPKERCQRSSPVVFKIVKETISALQRAETKIRATKTNSTDPDLFMIKNLLVLKNELLSLEIGDVRDGVAEAAGAGSVVWDTLSRAGDLPRNLIGGVIGTLGSYMPRVGGWSSPISRSGTPVQGTAPPAAGPTNGHAQAHPHGQDAGEQLDDLLRQSIYAFTRRWAALMNEAKGVSLLGGSKKASSGTANKPSFAKLEGQLNEMLERAFATQPEVIGKLKEAIEIEATQGGGGGASGREYGGRERVVKGGSVASSRVSSRRF